MNSIIVYAEQLSNREMYVIETLLGDFGGLNVQFAKNKEQLLSSHFPKLTYLQRGIEHIPNIQYSGNIEHGTPPDIRFGDTEQMNLHSLHSTTDVFAFCFFMLSRIEEYNSPVKDKHGRYPVEHSLAAKQEFLHVPVVDLMADWLKKWLSAHYPQLNFSDQHPSAILTFDIDIAYAFRAKPLLRQAGSMGKDLLSLNFQKLSARLNVLRKRQTDPFDVYDYLEKLAAGTGIPMIFFFQVVQSGKYDKANNTNSKTFRELVKRLSGFATIGIHPSYSGGQNSSNILQEKQILEKITGEEVIHSRQHFLRLMLPHTARELVKGGIRHDFSMGYAGQTGWRAGTCKPFRLFDAEMDEILPIITYPVSVMDGTLGEYMNLRTDEAAVKISEIISCTRQHNGTFIPLWHNETISDTGIWKGWRRDVFEKMVAELRTQIKF
jgi:hypothetical protein